MKLLTTSIDAVIFDMDGVVTRTATVHAAAWRRLFDEYLKEREGSRFRPFDADTDYRRYVDGKPRYDGVASFLESRGISLPYGSPDDPPDRETVCGLGNRKDGYFRDHLQHYGAEVYESTVKLIHDLKARDIHTAIFSASKNCGDILEAAGVAGLFETRVDGIEAERLDLPGKPDPAVLLEAARRLAVAPERAVIVEDAIAGVEAGDAGGFDLVIGVNRSEERGALLDHGADVEVEDLREVELVHGTPSTSDLPSALDQFSRIRRRMRDNRIAVFLDYDGTLTPIVERPEDALLTDAMRAIVERLARRCTVAIVSGRDLQDVRSMVGSENVYYAGSHGFDLSGPGGWSSEYERASEFLDALDAAQAELAAPVGRIAGARLERKRFAIAVHYRQVAPDHVPLVEAAVDRVAGGQQALRKTGGKKVFELRPKIDWHKGKAVLWLLRALNLDDAASLPFYLGDDVTDEDAFAALRRRGVGVVVADEHAPHQTEARFALRHPDDAGRLLERLAAELDK